MKYRKKPVIIDAIQMTREFTIDTLEGYVKGDAGDYLITGIEGEQYPCRERIFHQTYERVEKSDEAVQSIVSKSKVIALLKQHNEIMMKYCDLFSAVTIRSNLLCVSDVYNMSIDEDVMSENLCAIIEAIGAMPAYLIRICEEFDFNYGEMWEAREANDVEHTIIGGINLSCVCDDLLVALIQMRDALVYFNSLKLDTSIPVHEGDYEADRMGVIIAIRDSVKDTKEVLSRIAVLNDTTLSECITRNELEKK